MNILLINHYAGSTLLGMEFRPFYLAREWHMRGHQVTILAASYSHVRKSQPILSKTPHEESIDGICYRWYLTPKYQQNGLGRALNITHFLWKAFRDTRRLLEAKKPDVVIASSTYPMDIWLANHIAKKTGAKLVFEVHDLWPLSPIEIGGMSPSHPFIQVCQAAEDFAYRRSDLVVSMLPNVAEHAKAKGLPLERLAIVPNGLVRDEWEGGSVAPLRADVQAVIDEAERHAQRIVAYAGSHGLPNALDTLLDAASRLSVEPVCFLLVGDGHERQRLLRRVSDEHLANVHLLPPVPKEQIPALLSRAHAAYLGAPAHPIYRFGVSPNKMLDYMMAGVPILYAIEAGNDPVAEADCGLSLPAENADALTKGIQNLLALPADRLKAMGENGKRYALDHHTYDVLAEQFITAIQNATTRT